MANKAQPKLSFYKGYGENLKSLRKKNKLTQEELGKKINFSGKTINLIETEKRLPTIEQINEYCTSFNVSLDYLTGRTNISEPTAQLAAEYTGLSGEAINHLADMQYCDLNAPYKRTEIIENIILSGHFRKLLDTICEACLFAGAETLTKATEYTASSDGKTVDLQQLSRENLVELYSQKALKEFNRIIEKIIKEASEHGEHNKEE